MDWEKNSSKPADARFKMPDVQVFLVSGNQYLESYYKNHIFTFQ